MDAEKDPANLINQEKVLQLEEEISRHISELTSANKRLKRKIFDLYTIFEISRHLNSVLDTESLLDGIILTIIGQMGVSGCGIFTYFNEDENGLNLAKSKGFSLDHHTRYFIPFDCSLFQIISKAPNTTHHVADLTEKAPDSRREIELLKSVDCELVIPMSLKNKICGLLLVAKKISQTPFYEDDKDFLAILANQLSVAVENARLFESEKKAYNQLATAQRQLVETEKLAALGQLSARVAHEVNNPLGIIKNYLELILQSANDFGQIQGHVTILKEEVDRIAGIVRQLLDFYHPRPIQKGEVELARVLDEIITLVSVQLEAEGIRIIREYQDDFPPIWASAEQLKQVFLNLIMNAKDFMPEGGKIQISGSTGQDLVLLNFADTGPGIPEDSLSRIFEPFFTTRKDSSGIGLGLSVCYGIIQNHGGVISARNCPTGGAIFTLQLPIYHAEED